MGKGLLPPVYDVFARQGHAVQHEGPRPGTPIDLT